MNASEILDREFLEMRAKILELAAAFDRLDRASGTVRDDRRMELLENGISLLSESRDDRAEQVQLLFSRRYESDWRERFDLTSVR